MKKIILIPFLLFSFSQAFDNTFDDFSKEMNSLFQKYEQRFNDIELMKDSFKLDLKDSGKYYEIKTDLPGRDIKDVSITIENHILSLNVKKGKEVEEKGEHYIRKERSYSTVSRSIGLPADASSKFDTELKDGVLTIKIEKIK